VRVAKEKLSKEQKKAARSAKRQQRKQTFSNIKQAFVLTRKIDTKLVPYLIATAIVIAAVAYLLGLLLTGSLWVPIPVAVLLAALGALLLFSRRAQKSMFTQAEGQAGAAGWLLSQQLRGDWTLTESVAGTQQLDVVHRLVGRAGVVLVGEGTSHRVGSLLAQEKKRIARVAGDTPIYDLRVGTGEGEIRLSKLRTTLFKLPANLSKEEVAKLRKRLSALDSGRMPVPQGPIPQGAKMRNVQRTVRRRS
jgi:hypothetical protein